MEWKSTTIKIKITETEKSKKDNLMMGDVLRPTVLP